jgi:predicted N-formylglutamate amidohydrolase
VLSGVAGRGWLRIVRSMHAPFPALVTSQLVPDSFEIVSGPAAAGVLVLCDHASNAMPPEYDNLGLPGAQLARHIAYDIGAKALSLALAARLGCPAVLSCFSRLLIDPNRGDDDPTRVMRLSDGAIVPGNARIDGAEVERRAARFARPYHGAVATTLDAMLATGVVPAIVSIHSFTPQMRGRARPWQVGVLWDSDPRLPVPLIRALQSWPDLAVGNNEPYDGALNGDTMSRHCIPRGLAHVLIEVRQDLIAVETDARDWGLRLGDALIPLLADPAVRAIRHFGSRAVV